MKPLLFNICLLITVCFNTSLLAQELVAEKGSFGVDTKNKIIVWHITDLDAIKTANKNGNTIKFNKNYKLKETTIQSLSYKNSSVVSNEENYKLYITKLPLVHLTVDTSKMSNVFKLPFYFTFFNDKNYIKSTGGVRYRGNLSLSFPKKSFDLEFWKDSITRVQKDIKFANLRSDDDWILDGLFNEPLRLRSFVATNLWNEIHKPYYLKKEPKAKSTFRVKFVELFQNNTYYGIYQLSESVDRKQLKLKKKEKNIIKGELFKANSYKGGPDFTKSPEKYDDKTIFWNGWATRYPSDINEFSWKNLAEFSNLVVHGSDEDFVKNIENKFQLSNAIDYYLFVNLLKTTDNLGKNYYLGKYDKNEPYFFIPWDLDGSFGVVIDGLTTLETDGVLQNGLLKRLIETNPNGYKEKVKKRWTELRAKEFSNEALFSNINKIYNRFTDEKIYEREQLVWKNKLNETSNEDHYKFLEKWLTERLIYLDNQFNKL
ncbi:CotH kinase family protein [Polaribacter haliotis]|uniref:CotH kinase family protein n=1 Tax=Polaribacter haliotis TaxID=1888915 RepID=A0A7L8ADD0_9FLAO|nr:CotH kinase family protein [Polaribacter haliotis]QOD60005.1 CotH kinase family protein [Polaribacter haliotis]